MKKLFYAAFASIILITSLHVARASWYAPQGLPASTIINKFYFLHDTLFASVSQSGFYYTTNGGTDWTASSGGYYYYSGGTIFVNDSILFSAYGNDLYVSSDGGYSWSYGVLTEGIDVYSAVSVGDAFLVGTNSGVYRVTDSSGVWIGKQNGLYALYVGALVNVNGVLLAGVYGDGIYASADSGAHWVKENGGLTDLTVDLLTVFGDAVLCATDSSEFISMDGGASWSNMGSGLQGRTITCFEKNNSTYYAGTDSGVFRFDTTGGRWLPANSGYGKQVNAICFSQGSMLVGTNAGIYTSSVQTPRWSPVHMTLAGYPVYAMTVKDTELFAGTGDGSIYRSTDDAQSWVTTFNNFPANEEINALVSSNGSLFAAVWGDGIFRSTDDGMTWTLQNKADSAFVPEDVNTLYVYNGTVYAGTNTLIYYSNDTGNTWKHYNGVSDVEAFAFHDGHLYAANYSQVYRLMDDTIHWELVNKKLTSNYIHALYSYGGSLFAATSSDIDRTTDDGAEWFTADKGFPLNSEPYTFVGSGQFLFVGMYDLNSNDGSMYVTTNTGTTWTPISEGMQQTYVRSLLVNDGFIFAGTEYGAGVYRRPLYEILNGVDENASAMPATISLDNYPNPFGNATTITYSLPQSEHVTLNVFDALGRKIATPVDGERDAGVHSVPFTESDLQNGVYFYRLIVGSTMRTGTMVLAR